MRSTSPASSHRRTRFSSMASSGIVYRSVKTMLSASADWGASIAQPQPWGAPRWNEGRFPPFRAGPGRHRAGSTGALMLLLQPAGALAGPATAGWRGPMVRISHGLSEAAPRLWQRVDGLTLYIFDCQGVLIGQRPSHCSFLGGSGRCLAGLQEGLEIWAFLSFFVSAARRYRPALFWVITARRKFTVFLDSIHLWWFCHASS